MNNSDKVYLDWLYAKNDNIHNPYKSNHQLLRSMLKQQEANKIWLIQTITPRIEVARL